MVMCWCQWPSWTSTHSLQAKGVILPHYLVHLVYITLISAVSSAKHLAEHMWTQMSSARLISSIGTSVFWRRGSDPLCSLVWQSWIFIQAFDCVSIAALDGVDECLCFYEVHVSVIQRNLCGISQSHHMHWLVNPSSNSVHHSHHEHANPAHNIIVHNTIVSTANSSQARKELEEDYCFLWVAGYRCQEKLHVAGIW